MGDTSGLFDTREQRQAKLRADKIYASRFVLGRLNAGDSHIIEGAFSDASGNASSSSRSPIFMPKREYKPPARPSATYKNEAV